jgi:hypothetical protein
MSETELRANDVSSLVSQVCEELIRAIQEPLSPSELAELACGLDRSATGLGLSIPDARRIPESARTNAAPDIAPRDVERPDPQAKGIQRSL